MSDGRDSSEFSDGAVSEVVVVGVDASLDGLHALWCARDIAELRSALLVVVFVHHLPVVAAAGIAFGVGAPVLAASTDEQQIVNGRAQDLLADFAGAWRWHVREGEPARQLSAAADEFDADLIVIGAGHRNLAHRSIAHRLLQHTRRSILVCGRR